MRSLFAILVLACLISVLTARAYADEPDSGICISCSGRGLHNSSKTTKINTSALLSKKAKKPSAKGSANNCHVIVPRGRASFYLPTGNLTASGDPMGSHGFTAATPNLDPRAKHWLRVTNLKNNSWVMVKANDRGPVKALHRAIDLSKDAFVNIASAHNGIIDVKIEICQKN